MPGMGWTADLSSQYLQTPVKLVSNRQGCPMLDLHSYILFLATAVVSRPLAGA